MADPIISVKRCFLPYFMAKLSNTRFLFSLRFSAEGMLLPNNFSFLECHTKLIKKKDEKNRSQRTMYEYVEMFKHTYIYTYIAYSRAVQYMIFWALSIILW